MNLGTKTTTLAVIVTMATAALSPMALADSRQTNKNNWRNLAGVGAAVAGYGLLKHNTTATVLGAAGTAYSLHRYEQDRHSQDQAKRARQRYYRSRYNRTHRYHRSHRSYR